MKPVLIYFRWSHYNEKARWALEYKGIAHTRRTLLPGKHMREAHRLTGRTTLPILILDGRPIGDSTRIIEALEAAYPARPLYPRDPAARARALELEDYFDEQLGPHLRRVVQHAVWPYTRYAAHLFDAGAGWFERWTYRAMFQLLKPRLAARFALDPATVADSRRRTLAALARLEAEIQPSGYLVGGQFSVADLTAAAMLSVLALPDEFPCLPRLPLPPRVADLSREFAHSAALRWARDIYRRHRGAVAERPRTLPVAASLSLS